MDFRDFLKSFPAGLEAQMSNTFRALQKKKAENIKISALTVYDALWAEIMSEAAVDMVLVGDSLGNVVHGFDSTVLVTMEMMIMHTQAVAKALQGPLLVADMPFASYHASIPKTIENMAKLMRAGASGLKIEGAGSFVLKVVARAKEAGIPVVGHLGFTPQQIKMFGGNYVQGKSQEDADKIIQDALSLEKAGAVMLVLEMVPAVLAQEISLALKIPVIGIGAGKGCDGQILVMHDMLGLTNNNFKFVKRYVDFRKEAIQAIKNYHEEVVGEVFPSKDNQF